MQIATTPKTFKATVNNIARMLYSCAESINLEEAASEIALVEHEFNKVRFSGFTDSGIRAFNSLKSKIISVYMDPHGNAIITTP